MGTPTFGEAGGRSDKTSRQWAAPTGAVKEAIGRQPAWPLSLWERGRAREEGMGRQKDPGRSRRRFLRSIALGAGTAAALPLLEACGGTPAAPAAQPAAPAPAAPAPAAPAPQSAAPTAAPAAAAKPAAA